MVSVGFPQLLGDGFKETKTTRNRPTMQLSAGPFLTSRVCHTEVDLWFTPASIEILTFLGSP